MNATDARKPLALVGAEAPRGAAAPTRKIAAILCADVAGYSRLMGEDDVATLLDMLATRRVFARHVEAGQGRLVDTAGDSMLADFGSAVQALEAAVAVQQELRAENALRPASRSMQLRIGLNVGDILEHDAALYGDGVNIAARLQALGEPGGVCVSAAVHDLVEGRLPVAFEYAGEHRVKNIRTPLCVFHVRSGGTPDAQAVVAHAAAHAAEPRRAPLPQALSSFIGRDEQIQALRHLAARHRLITLVGPGGIGKTRLAQRLALLSPPPLRVWFVELAALADARLLLQAVAAAVGVHEASGRAGEEALLERLADAPTLIVLDNCEHLAQGCAALARKLLAAVPELRILATSREPLRIAGELAYPLPPLSLPLLEGGDNERGEGADEAMPAAALGAFEATRLFVERAGEALPGFAATPQNAAALVRICRRLDGMPLPIELAAARVRVMSVDDIERRLDRVFSLLVDGDRSASPRQQALRATIDWSHDLLDDAERCVFRRLAVFGGSWTLDAAEDVAAGGGIEREQVLGVLARLVEKSLVMRGDAGRYRLLQTMRQYAAEKLAASGEGAAVRDRHLGCYLRLAEEAREHLRGPGQREWHARLDAEQDNLLAAHAWCGQATDGGEAGLRLMFALKLYLHNRGQFQLLRWGLEEALARPGAEARTPLRSKALFTLGQVLGILGRREAALPHLEEALAIAEDLGDPARAAMVLMEMGMSSLARGDMEAARRHFETSVERARACGDQRVIVASVSALAHWHRVGDEFERAEALYTRALELAQELQDQQTIAVALMNLAIAALARGDEGAAGRLLLQAGGIALALASRPAGQCLLAVASGLAALRQDWPRVVRLAAASEAEAGNTGMFLDPADRIFLEPLWERARRELAETTHAAETGAGRSGGYDRAMRDAMAWLAAIGTAGALSR